MAQEKCPHCGEVVAVAVTKPHGENPGGDPPRKKMARSRVQSVLFAKSDWTVGNARKWLRRNKFKAGKVKVGSGKYFHFEQFVSDPGSLHATVTFQESPKIKALLAGRRRQK